MESHSFGGPWWPFFKTIANTHVWYDIFCLNSTPLNLHKCHEMSVISMCKNYKKYTLSTQIPSLFINITVNIAWCNHRRNNSIDLQARYSRRVSWHSRTNRASPEVWRHARRRNCYFLPWIFKGSKRKRTLGKCPGFYALRFHVLKNQPEWTLVLGS